MTNSRRDRWIYLGVLGVTAAVFISGVITWLARDTDRSSSDRSTASQEDARALAPSPFAVTLTVKSTAGVALLGAPVNAIVETAGKVSEVALWDGAVKVAGSTVRGEGSRSEFTWTPLRTGRHVLQARATGDSGKTALSAPVSVAVRRPSVDPEQLVVPAVDGLDARTVAAMAGVAASDVRPGQATEQGEKTFVVDTVDLGTKFDDPDALVENPEPVAGEPSLKASVDGCTVTLEVTGVDGGASIYQASGTGGGSVEIATVDGDGTTKLPDLGPGTHVFSLGIDGKSVVGDPVSVTFGPECKQSWWGGDASITDGVLRIPEAAPNLYAYIGVDDDPFFRIPQAPGTFLPASTSIDIAQYLPHLAGSTLRIEVWSGTDPAKKVASGTATLPEGSTVTDLIGESTQTVLATSVAKVAPNADEVTFRWATGNAHPTGVWWQVLAYPVSSQDQTLSPPGLLAAGVAPTGKIPPGLVDGAAAGGSFSLAPSTLLKAIGPAKVDDDAIQVVSPVAAKLGNLLEGTPPQPVSGGLPIIGGPSVYVRVLPMRAGHPLGAASPTVKLFTPKPTQPPTETFDLFEARFDAGRAANPNLSGCVRVSKVPWTPVQAYSLPGKLPPGWVFVAPFYPYPGTYCYNDFGHDSGDDDCGLGFLCDVADTFATAFSAGVDALGDMIAPVWDFIASTYNGLIDLAATAIATLNPWCLAAGAAANATGSADLDDVQSTCQKLSKVAGKAAIAAVLSAYGLPPSLPTSEQLAAIAEGRVEDLGVQLLKDLGVPCDDLKISPEDAAIANKAGVAVPAEGVDACRLFVEQTLAVVKEQAAAAAQTNVGTMTGLPYPPMAIDGFSMQLEPRQFPEPPSLFVEGRPQKADPPKLAVCPVTFDLDGPDAAVSGVIGRWSSTWAVSMQVPVTKPAAEAQVLRGTLSSADCLTATPSEVSGTVGPPLGRWKPGEKD